MINLQKIIFLKKTSLILALILIIFFIKGVILSSAFPIFGGQDESRHYNSIQYLNEPKEKTWAMEIQTDKQNKDNLDSYRYSDEIKQASLATNTDVLRGEIFNTISFSNSDAGINENQINQKLWEPINHITPPDVVSGSLYHKIASFIEKAFAGQDILFRFYLIRIFSVLLGTFAILLSFLIAKNIGLSSKHSLLLAAIISFQPKFSMYFANINYDVLMIPMFFLFTLAGVLILKKGLNWKNLTLLLFSIIIAVMTKPTGYILVIIFLALIAYLVYEKVKLQNKRIQFGVYGLSSFVFIFASLFLYRRFFTLHPLGETMGSIVDYVSKTITFGKFVMPSSTYWGNLSWVNNWFLNNVTDFIFVIEMMAIIGLGMLLFSKKVLANFLPEKKYVVFLIGMIVALQLGIRVADWNIFSQIGGMKLSTGTPGRYFLPNVASHIILTFVGIGTLFSYFKKEKYFDYSLIAGLILMMTFMMYLIFDVVVYRFYI